MYSEETFRDPSRQYGVLQIVHDFQFVAYNLKDDYTWPEDSDEEFKIRHIKERMERLKDLGYSGIVLNVAFKKYMEDEQAWFRLNTTVEMAKELGFRIWIYDEKYYPSGFAGGLTLRDHPEFEAQGLACVKQDIDSPDAPVRIASPLGHSTLKYAFAVPVVNDKLYYEGQVNISNFVDAGGGLCWNCAGGKWRVYAFFTRTLFEGTYLPYAMRAPQRNISVCNDRAVERFLDITFGRYEKYLGDMLSNDIEAVFTDEPALFLHHDHPEGFKPGDRFNKHVQTLSIQELPNLDIPMYPFIHWTYNTEEKFKEICGYSLIDNLPRLFENEEGDEKLRIDFFQTINHLFDCSWNKQYKERMQKLNISYSGHMLSEEDLHLHPSLYGDIIRNLGSMDIPGCDLLYSAPDKIRHSVACKLASSAAHLYNRKHVMIEASNMLDKNQSITLDDLCLAMAIEHALGVDTITSYYGEKIMADEEYKEFNKYVSRLGELMDGGIHQSQALIYYPYKQVAAVSGVQDPNNKANRAEKIERSFNELSRCLLEKQIDFDYINDECLLKGSAQNGAFYPGNGEQPFMIVLPEINFLPEETAQKLRDAMEAGVLVIAAGKKRTIRGLEDCDSLRFVEEDGLPDSRDIITESSCPQLLCMHKKFEGQEIYLLVNTGNDPIETVSSIPYAYDSLLKLCLKTGSTEVLECSPVGDRLQFQMNLGSMNAMVLVNKKLEN